MFLNDTYPATERHADMNALAAGDTNFVRKTLRLIRISRLMIRHFPASWDDALKRVIEQVQATQPNIVMLRPFIDPQARKALIHSYSDHEVDAMLDRTWASYADLAPAVPVQETIGARFMVHLSALTLAMYETLLSAGQSAEGATTLIYDVGWLVYTKMGAVPWAMAGAFSQDGYDHGYADRTQSGVSYCSSAGHA